MAPSETAGTTLVIQNGLIEEENDALGCRADHSADGSFAMLALWIIWASFVWNTGENLLDKHGWTALGVGISFSLLIGCGLMALMFFSHRSSGHDDPADPFRRPDGRDREV
jgi:hypothetical protein